MALVASTRRVVSIPLAGINVNVICPPLAQVPINTYQSPIQLFLTGSGEIPSTEGTPWQWPHHFSPHQQAERTLP